MLKKRLLSLVLIAAMLVAIFPIGVSAATETVDGTQYTVVSTSQELYNALATGGNILLKNDIALDSEFESSVTVSPGTVLNGNGFALTYSGNRTAPLFKYAAGTTVSKATSYIRNIDFGTKSAPFVLTAGNALFVEAKADTCQIIYQNVDFYVKGSSLTGTKIGGIYASLTGLASFYGCTLDADLTASSSSLFGGWIGEITGGDLVMTDCVTLGTITGDKASHTGAFVGQAGGGNSRFTGCTNLANVSGPNSVAGFVGNVGTGAASMYFTGCRNFGNITSDGTAYGNMAGGFLGRATNRADQDNKRLRVLYDCINYGTITSGARAGGFVGSPHDYDTNGQGSNYLYYTFENCVNYGSVNGDAYAGGIIGIASPITYRAEITNCINVGKITSSDGYAGNFAGMLSSGVITGGYAAGVVSTALGTDVLAPHTSGTYQLQAGKFSGQYWDIIAPTVSNVKYIGSKSSVASGITEVTNENLSAALKDMSSLCGVSFVAADSTDASAYVVAAEPILRGVQQSVAVSKGRADLRFIAGINAVNAYQKFGFKMTVHANGRTEEAVRETTSAYTSLSSVSVNGTLSSVTADSKASKYLCAITLTGIPIADDVVIEVTPYAVATDGTKFEGNTRVVSCKNGIYQVEPMVLNDVLLEDYAIVYASSDKLSEKLLATRMADEIAKLTGVALPVLSDTQTCNRKAKLLIGKTSQTTVSVTGRTICTQNSPYEIVISGVDTAQLSEAITYFLDTVEEKMNSGINSWKFESSVTVPVDTELSLMAYNLGAQDNSYLKKAEWDLIVDYLPDIMTFQEPWAGFLDDFLNNYAVQPTEKFVASSSDDDVMVSDVDNKAFTGNGYYGVYWGLPRWVPGDPCTAGKASYSVILYAKDRFTVDTNRSGTFWLSNQVNVSGTNYQGSNFARCATYATLTDRNTGKTFTVVNVHLDFVAEVQIAQINILLRELKTRLGTDMPIFITGDMNSEAHSAPIKLYKENSVMPMTAMDDVAERAYRQSRNIDWFFTNQPDQVDVSYYNYCGEHTFLNKIWNSSLIMGRPSDHPAIYTEFKFR